MTSQETLVKAIEKYDVTEDGKVFNKKTGKQLKPHYDGMRYPYISIYMGKDLPLKKLNIHRFVAHVYLPNPENLPQVNHKDGNHENNAVENLEWCTVQYNVSDGFKRGRVVWNKDNVSKERIMFYCKKYPRQIFWML